ncbi:MAG: beta-ketoacyl-ACP synthase II [Candidatus Eremiobacteraeota bacterium]|nr:beta-ketoacyl-ACP synthase II [Candidatus Eremiobacteraeota bacterium]
MEDAKRVVVTGAGVVSPYGIGVDVLWNSLLEGKSAIDRITAFDTTEMASKIAAEVKDFDPTQYIDRKTARRMDRFLQFAVAATKMCIEDSGLEITDENRKKIGVSIGSGIGGMGTLEKTHEVLLKKGPSKVSPFFIPMILVNMPSGMAAINHGLTGPNLCTVTACATGAHNIGLACDIIREGKAQAMVVGGTEATITPLSFAGFCSMRAVSFSNDEPKKASRPFDKNRDGFVMGEGCTILMLESLESAKSRGAKVYGEIVGFGMSADAYHITQPHPEGLGAILAMEMALEDAGIKPEKIDYINAHGTATPLGDIAETKAIKKVFGAHSRKLAVSSTKSMTGHILGAAGAIETLIILLATQNNIVPPTINLNDPDPECDLDYVPNKARKMPVNYAMNNSFGFGGQDSVLIVKKYEDE